jgi:DNA-binding response OmpR family regulator
MRLLIVEDDDLLGEAVQKGLSRDGYAVDWICKGSDLPGAICTHQYDAVLLDLGLPDTSGEALLGYIRQHRPDVPVLVMTARGAIHDRVSLLDIGADDYMVKPIDLEELEARLRAVIRRMRSTPETEIEIEHRELKLVPARRSATWNGIPVQLTNKEYWLLETLVRKKNRIVTRAQLEEALYGWGEEIGSNAVEVYVHFLRRKFCNDLIQTVRGVGYQLG